MAAVAKLGDRFLETRIDDEIVVMDLESGDFFSLAGTSLAIWQLIDGTLDRDAIAAELAREFDAPPATIAADVDGLLRQLSAAGLVA